MKTIAKYTAIILLSLSVAGCASIAKLIPGLYSGPTTKNSLKVDKSQAKVQKEYEDYEAIQKRLGQIQSEIDSNKVTQGSVFVYGTGKALDRATNKEPAVVLAKDLNDLAKQALPKPATAEVVKIEQAVDNTLSTNKHNVADGLDTIQDLRDKLIAAEAAKIVAEAKYQKRIQAAKEDLEQAAKKMNQMTDTMAKKADAYDEADSMIGAAKLFLKNFGKFIIFGVAILVIWFIAKIAMKIYFPPIALGMNVVEGVSKNTIQKGYVELVKGGELFKEAIKSKGPVLLEDLKKGLYTTEEAMTELLNEFRNAQERAQSTEVQETVKALTKKKDIK